MVAKTLNAKNLEAFGPAKLAELLIEVSTGNAVAQRRLRLELAGNAGPQEAAREIGKRLAAISRSKTYIDWQKVKPLMVDLSAQHAAILAKVAPAERGRRSSSCGGWSRAPTACSPVATMAADGWRTSSAARRASLGAWLRQERSIPTLSSS